MQQAAPLPPCMSRRRLCCSEEGRALSAASPPAARSQQARCRRAAEPLLHCKVTARPPTTSWATRAGPLLSSRCKLRATAAYRPGAASPPRDQGRPPPHCRHAGPTRPCLCPPGRATRAGTGPFPPGPGPTPAAASPARQAAALAAPTRRQNSAPGALPAGTTLPPRQPRRRHPLRELVAPPAVRAPPGRCSLPDDASWSESGSRSCNCNFNNSSSSSSAEACPRTPAPAQAGQCRPLRRRAGGETGSQPPHACTPPTTQVGCGLAVARRRHRPGAAAPLTRRLRLTWLRQPPGLVPRLRPRSRRFAL